MANFGIKLTSPGISWRLGWIFVWSGILLAQDQEDKLPGRVQDHCFRSCRVHVGRATLLCG